MCVGSICRVLTIEAQHTVGRIACNRMRVCCVLNLRSFYVCCCCCGGMLCVES